MEKGLSGEAIGGVIHQMRVAAVSDALKAWDDQATAASAGSVIA